MEEYKCEQCGKVIFVGQTLPDGVISTMEDHEGWIKGAGICVACERELCYECADGWINDMCQTCNEDSV